MSNHVPETNELHSVLRQKMKKHHKLRHIHTAQVWTVEVTRIQLLPGE